MAAKEVSKLDMSKLKTAGPVVPEPPPELFTQRKRAEVGRYRLLVDRQLKRSFVASKDAEAAGLIIKKDHPVVQVAVYDVEEGVNKVIELPKTE
jgi:hypothetical protein